MEAKIHALCEEDEVRQAARALIEAYGPEILGFVAGVLHNEDDARDVFQEWCISVLLGLGDFQWRSTARTWSYTLARNARVDFLRERSKRRRERRLETREAEHLSQVIWDRTVPYRKTDVKNKFIELRKKLDPEERELLILRVDRKMSWIEVAEVFGAESDERAHPNTMAQRFKRLKDKLREMMEAEGLLNDPNNPPPD